MGTYEMLTLLDDTTYKAVIDAMEKKSTSASTEVIVIKGWAVDKLRHRALAMSTDDNTLSLKRQERGDIANTFELDEHEPMGFRIELDTNTDKFDIRFLTPAKKIGRTIYVANVRRTLRLQGLKGRVLHTMGYLSNLGSREGLRVFGLALQRHLFGLRDREYSKWIAKNETLSRSQAVRQLRSMAFQPLISIVTPVYNVEEQWLRQLVKSMQNQWYGNWELCLADDCSSAPHIKPLLNELADSDPRIKVVFREKNGQISEATNSAIELVSGDYIGFMDNDDELAPQALFEVIKSLNDDSSIDFIYTDEDKINEQGTRFDPFFKPGFSPNLLLSHNYITHFVVVSKELLSRAGTLRSEYNGSQDYDFVLRATELAHRVKHIPQMLYHWRTLDSSVAGDPRSKMYAYEAGQHACEDALKRRGIDATVNMLNNYGTYKTEYAHPTPSVTVFALHYSESQFDALQRLTDYPNVQFVRVDEQQLQEQSKACQSEYIAVLDEVLPQTDSWLSEFINYAYAPGVGVVGGKIMDSDDRVVNAGITLRALRSGRPFEMRGKWDEGVGYYFRDLLPREMFAVTEECLLVSRDNYNAVRGIDFSLPAGLRGIDFCNRLREQTGANTLWEPYSVFTDTKHNPLRIDPKAVAAYLKVNHDLEDPFASAYFPYDRVEQMGINCCIDLLTYNRQNSTLEVTGWAADLHSNENPEITVAEDDGASLVSVERILRPDINTGFALPDNELYGFKAIISVDLRKLVHRTVTLELGTSTDHQSVEVRVPRSGLKPLLAKINRRLHLMMHPRTAFHAMRDRYLSGKGQQIAYQKLITRTEQYDADAVRHEIEQWQHKPLLSIVIPVYNVDERWLNACVDSVRAQYYDNWELCLADDCSTKPHVKPLLRRLEASDDRIKVVFREKNGHISRATNSAINIATGDFIVLMDNDDEIPPQALYEVAKVLNQHPDADIIYSDEDKIDENGHRFDPHFKPDYSPDLLLSTNYISHLGVYRASLVREVGGFRAGYEGSQDYDLVLRISELTSPERIRHIAKVLYHWRTLPTSTASGAGAKNYASEAGLKAMQSAMERRGIDADVVPSIASGIYDVHYKVAGNPLVSVIIPTKNGYDNIERCLDSIIDKTTYSNYEVIIADNGSTNPHMNDLYQRYAERLGDRFRVEELDMPFNFSRINNLAAKTAKGEFLLFLNDDTEVISPQWMERMVSFAQLERVGVVGAKLYYPTDTIQHSGIVLGLGGVAGHIQAGFPRNYLGYFGRLIENVNYYAVTAACCMVKAADFWAVQGFDEDLAVAYNDVDLCIRVHNQLGRDNVWAHEAELYHYESVTRGYDVASTEKLERLKRESAKFEKKYPDIVKNDPYYNPNLSRTSGNYWIREQ